MKLRIKNARLLSLHDHLDQVGDLLINNGKIIALGGEVPEKGEEEVIDAAGLCVAPGLVDLFARAYEPATDEQENVRSLAWAAALGGYTTVCVHTGAYTAKEILQIKELSGYAACDLIPAARATDGKHLLPYSELLLAGAPIIYDDEPIDDPQLMRDALFRARKNGVLLMSRCRENRLCGEGLMRGGSRSLLYSLPSIPASAESIMVARDIILSGETGSPVHLSHISTAESVAIIRIAKEKGTSVTCSTEPNYFGLDCSAIFGYNTLAKLDPPLGNPEDVEAIIGGLKDGTIDCIASGHVPVPKAGKVKSLVTAAYGASSLEIALAVSLTALYHTGALPLSRVLDLMSGAPASLLGLEAGRLCKGADADLVIFDPDEQWVCNQELFVSHGKCTPFHNHTLKGKVTGTIKAGRVLAWKGELK